jgi:hypothetical protein
MIIKRAGLLAAAGTLLFAAGIISPANATVLNVTVWTGSPDNIQSSQTADLGHKPAAANIDATFQYNTSPAGLALNFNDTSAQNTTTAGGLFSAFFATDPGSINAASFASPDGAYASGAAGIAQLLATSMSIAGNAYTTYISFTGTFDFGGGLVTVRHDDGASFYLTDGPPVAEFTSPAETTAISNSFTLSGVHSFELDYVAGNGTPSILQVTAVPEASTWAMMVLGFFGVGFMAYRRKGTLPQLRLA